MIKNINYNDVITFVYKNYKGEVAERKVIFRHLQCGSNEFHPTEQFLLVGWDCDKKAFRSFAIADIDARSVKKVDDAI